MELYYKVLVSLMVILAAVCFSYIAGYGLALREVRKSRFEKQLKEVEEEIKTLKNRFNK